MSTPVRHLSIDFWSTLYRPNPAFSVNRIEQIVAFFSPAPIDRHRLESSLGEVGRQNDLLTNTQGISATQEELYGRVFSAMGLSASPGMIRSLCEELDELFLHHRPILIDPAHASLLSRLSAKGLTLNISSNTAFVLGHSLERCIHQDGLQDLFDFMLFSDQLGCAKPSPQFFEAVLKRVSRQLGSTIAKEAILHAGDNLLADISGASSFGFQTLHIATPTDLFKLESYG